ncbi:MAG: hypothetical protein D6806_07125 [Deltaproteobacteria bacterium]|nr:MAG: hypothetical protein D6806_07125 [Deltaproteobacteria bacterium]
MRVPAARLRKELDEYPEQRWRDIAAGWLRLALWRQGVFLRRDLERLGPDEKKQLCRVFDECSSPSRMPAWRIRYILWLLRDREVLSLSRRIDERRRTLTPVNVNELDDKQLRVAERYLRMLGRLRFRARTEKDSGKARTLRGTLRGLRYVETLREACSATGLDYILMFRLLIQESAFVHERVSWAGAFSLAQFLNIALKDVWMFRRKIPGALELLGEVKDEKDLKRKVVSDPHMAIRVACLYFRRLRDEVVLRLGHRQSVDARMRDIVTLEIYSLRQAMEQAAEIDSLIESRRVLGPNEVLVPLGPTPLPDPGVALGMWVKKLVMRLVERRMSEELFEQRLQRLYDALGLAAYNAGMQNLLRAARKRKKLSALAFPLEIEETRNYVDDILDGADFLRKLERELSPFSEMSFDELLQVVLPYCE